ncbi:MAG: hypothetical protein KAY37_00865 [Phycisphaerae bacterium]|nr:hypothetical protein [Phycisphaerae bacterium]
MDIVRAALVIGLVDPNKRDNHAEGMIAAFWLDVPPTVAPGKLANAIVRMAGGLFEAAEVLDYGRDGFDSSCFYVSIRAAVDCGTGYLVAADAGGWLEIAGAGDRATAKREAWDLIKALSVLGMDMVADVASEEYPVRAPAE